MIQDRLVLEIVGYAASALVALSLTMRSIVRLRVINLVGAVIFTVYGILIGAFPVAFVNAFIVVIDLYYLLEMLRTREYFTVLDAQQDSQYLQRFIEHYQQDIRTFLPDFDYQPGEALIGFFVLRNMVPAGLVLGEVHGEEFLVRMDYVIPGYRDFKIGRYVYTREQQRFSEMGVRAVISPAGSKAHQRYLERMGFTAEEGGACYRFNLTELSDEAA
mgnify:CR=1 FL=1